MKRMTAGDLQALELLMQTTPGFEHFDSGADGILPECRSCRFHRPLLEISVLRVCRVSLLLQSRFYPQKSKWHICCRKGSQSWITKSKSSRMNSLEKSEQP